MLIDTHAHLNFSAFKNDLEEVIKRTLENDVWVINVGSQYSTSKRAVEIAQKYKEEVYPHTNGALRSVQISKCAPSGVGVYAAVGLHPIHLEERKVDHSEVDVQAVFKTSSEEFDYEKYKELAQNSKVVAIGEIGLDYWYKPKTKKKLEEFKERQGEVFLKQLNLAKELNLPIILHCRIAHDDLLKLLELQVSSYKLQGVIHCFTGNRQQAQKYLDLGFYLGFNGLIFKKIEGAPDWQEIIKKLPLEKILIETDAPYLTPPPFEGQRNEPLYVKYVAQKIAEIKNITFEEVAKITTQNAKALFKI
jgi:TatD DNase family protein